MKAQEKIVHEINQKLAAIDFNDFELKMAQSRAQDLENQMDDIMSGEFNAQKTIEKMSREIRELKLQKQEIEERPDPSRIDCR